MAQPSSRLSARGAALNSKRKIVNSSPLSSLTPDILTARITIGYLGEASQFNWWPTSFFDQTAKTFLDPIFPKTAKLAQYHGVVEAARRQHDEHLSTSAYHLFRLPEEVEAELDETLKRLNIENFDPHLSKSIIDGSKVSIDGPVAAPVGPISIGNVADIFRLDTIKMVTDIYTAAFSSWTRAYPYFAR